MATTDWQGFQQQAPAKPRPEGVLGWLGARATAWEDWLTYGITMLVFLAVAGSIQNADWVETMPSLALIGFLGVTTGLLLARARINQFLAHFIALVLGSAVVFWQSLTITEGSTFGGRVDDLYLRMEHFFDVAFNGLISDDNLPFVILVIGLTWLAAYFFSWSVFRWNNAWIGLIPAGIGLFANFFYFQEENFSFLFIVFAFSSLMLIMRVNLMRRLQQWKAEGIQYPEFISLSFLHLTSWAALAMLIMASILPVGGEAKPFTGIWDQVTRPFDGYSTDFARLFTNVQTRQIRPIHSFENFLPFKGSLPERQRVVLDVKTDETTLSSLLLLHGAAYNEYTSAGWLMGDKVGIDLGAADPVSVQQQLEGNASLGKRLPVEAEITVIGSRRSVLFSIGQPLASSVSSVYDLLRLSNSPNRSNDNQVAPLFMNGLALQSRETQQEGSTYNIVGTLPNVTPTDLRTAGNVYPSWVRDLYMQLPDELPGRVQQLAQEVTVGSATEYDAALAIENYLRQPIYTFSRDVPDVPVGRDTVDHFLFESRQGFFDYYASAMTVMLRSLGIPSRLAVGFVLEEQDPVDDSYTVRDRHAYAWSEAYFPGVGWVQFNPSPDRAALSGATIPEQVEPAGTTETFDDVLPGEELIEDPEFPEAAPVAAEQGEGGTPMGVWIALAVLSAFALAGAAGYFAWERSVAGLPYPQRIWEKTVRLASWAGAKPKPNQTPQEYIRDVSKLAPYVDDTNVLADEYGRSRFGKAPLETEEQRRLREVWEPLRNKLIARILRWK